MAMFKCPVCGRGYAVETVHCEQEMERDGNTLTCPECDETVEIPSCHGEEMEMEEE